MPSVTQQLACTRTARWLRRASGPQRSAQWADRMRCFGVLPGLMGQYRAGHAAGERWQQPPVRVPGLLMSVAQELPAAHEWVYQKWRADQKDNVIPRWAGPDRAVKPLDAFIAEAKIVSFWQYRAGALEIADELEMNLIEVAATYFRALAAWASQQPLLAACIPAGPPLCVPEDTAVLALRARRGASPAEAAAAGRRLAELGGHVVRSVLDDASITPLGAFNTVRDEALQLLSAPPAPIAVRVNHALAELADQLLHPPRDGLAVTAGQARQLQTTLTALSALLGAGPAAPASEPAGEPLEEADL